MQATNTSLALRLQAHAYPTPLRNKSNLRSTDKSIVSLKFPITKQTLQNNSFYFQFKEPYG